MTLDEFIQRLEWWGNLQPSPFEPVELSGSDRWVACECGAPDVELHHVSFEVSTTREITAAAIGQCGACLRIYWRAQESKNIAEETFRDCLKSAL